MKNTKENKESFEQSLIKQAIIDLGNHVTELESNLKPGILRILSENIARILMGHLHVETILTKEIDSFSAAPDGICLVTRMKFDNMLISETKQNMSWEVLKIMMSKRSGSYTY